jgi:hypothetical protein
MSDMKGADKEAKELAGRRESERSADMDRMFEFVNQKPVVGAGMPQMDDDGNPMPGNVQDTAAKRQELARALVRARTPQVAQFGLQELLKEPAKPATYKLNKGEVVKDASGRIIADNPEAPKAEKPQRMEIGGSVVEFGPGGEAKVVYKGEGKRDIRTVGRSVVEITAEGPKVLFTAPKEGGGEEKAPAGYKWAPGGTLEPIKGGPADPSVVAGKRVPKEPTEDERKSAGYAIRMENALRAMNDPELAGSSGPEKVAEAVRNFPLVGGDLVANAVTSEPRQRVEAAQLDALDAALTLATGAAYTKEQLKNLSRSYFPQLGDGEKTKEDKKRRLQEVIETARIRAGRAAPSIDRVTGGSGGGGKFTYIGVEEGQ